jgi:hypothetical protein
MILSVGFFILLDRVIDHIEKSLADLLTGTVLSPFCLLIGPGRLFESLCQREEGSAAEWMKKWADDILIVLRLPWREQPKSLEATLT